MTVPLTTPPVLNTPPCSGQHKTRLLVGEGNFSFALALINKHDGKAGHNPAGSLAHSIIATELSEKIGCKMCLPQQATPEDSLLQCDDPQPPSLCFECQRTVANVEELKRRGAHVLLGVDGTKLDQIEELKNKRIHRIHWNGPHDGKYWKDQTLPPIIKGFFESSRDIQKPNDRVHISLKQPLKPTDQEWYQTCCYDIVNAATYPGYIRWSPLSRQFDA